jgi:hypothetical protein
VGDPDDWALVRQKPRPPLVCPEPGCDVELISYENLNNQYNPRIFKFKSVGSSCSHEHLILADLVHGTPGMVIDPPGRLAERIARLAPPEHAGNLVLLEVDQERPFGLNLLDVDSSKGDYVTLAADSVLEAIKKLHGEADAFQPRLENWLDLAVRVVIKNDGTLVDVPRLFLDKRFRQTYLKNVNDPGVLREFEDYDSLRPGEQRNQVESVNRLARTCRAEAFELILGSKTTTVPPESRLV